MAPANLDRLREITSFPLLIEYLRDELDWPVQSEEFDDTVFEFSAAELGIDPEAVVKVKGIQQLRPFASRQPWGVFLIEFEPKRLPVVVLRRILRALVSRKRESDRPAERRTWNTEDLLFVCAQGNPKGAAISFVHFAQPLEAGRQARLTSFGWSPLSRNRTVLEFNLPPLRWPADSTSPDDWRRQWLKAFDKEALTRRFYQTLDRIYKEAIVPEIRKTVREEDKARQAGLLLLNRLLFLYFVQKKGWLDGAGDFLARAFEDYRAEPRSRGFYSEFLCPLFEALSRPKGDPARNDRFERVPFLNGGLFEPDALISDSDLKVPNGVFARLFDELLEPFNFTVTEDTPLDVEVAVDPEMLGKVFEELVTGRHETGSYYTPRPVVSFMCREALKGYLGNGKAVEDFVERHNAVGLRDPEAILQKLRAVRVCDPACGSGAYLVGMLQELLALRHCLFAAHRVDPRDDYNRKLDIIQSNLYGVDIDPVAVNIARLRLWLTLVVEYESDGDGDPPPLPNLDFKIEQGDSILSASPKIETDISLFIDAIREFAALKERYIKEVYNKPALKRQLDKLRGEIAHWIFGEDGAMAFDWRVDFVEVMAREAAPGFDIVLANPPYVRQEIIRAMKPQLKALYPDIYTGTADLFTYFFARALELLRPGGLMVFICSSTWTKTAAAGKLRKYLHDQTTVARFLDFGDLQVFENVTTYPAIIIVEKSRPPRDHQIRASQVRTILPSELEDELHAPGILVPQAELEEQGWRFEDRRIARLREKIRDAGAPLKDVVQGQIYRGILTGLNEAFVIDQQTRDALVADDPRSMEILKPFLEGKDLKPWRAEWRGLWLIRIHAGWTNKTGGPFRSEKDALAFFQKRYSAVAQWLASFEKAAKKRQDKGDWYWELRACAYYDEFEKPKIMYPDISNRPKFVYDEKGVHFANTTYFLPGADRYLQGILCSNLMWWQVGQVCPALRGGLWRFRLFTQYMETLSIAFALPADKRKIASLTEALSSDDCPNRPDLEAELNDRVAALYGLTAEERKIIGGLAPSNSEDAMKGPGD